MSRGYKHLTRIRRGLAYKENILSCNKKNERNKIFSFQNIFFGVLHVQTSITSEKNEIFRFRIKFSRCT